MRRGWEPAPYSEMLDFRLCVITERWRERGHIDVAKAAIAGGAGAIQLRDKELPARELFEIGRQIRDLCRQAGVLFFVNDRPDLALALHADGVHIGQDDLPVAEARRLLDYSGRRLILGASAPTPEEARAAEKQGADYVSVGPVFATATKADAGPAVGLETIGHVKSACYLPVVAIGGISAENARSVIEAGADAVAVISAVTRADDMERATRELAEAVAARSSSHP